MTPIALSAILDSGDESIYNVPTKAPGPQGALPLTPEIMLQRPSGDLFGWTMDAAMGWDPGKLGSKEVLILSTHGGLRAPDGRPIALGLHTGHWEVNLLVEAAARELASHGAIPFATYCSDPCDGRTMGTPGMFDSLAFRNDAASLFRRQIRSLPTRSGVLGVATCDKGVPSMMMALASMHDLPCILVPGGVMLLAEDGWNAAEVQSIGAQYLHGQITLEEAA
ncbi:MAG: YjhG/YagF family D-xylonate dehydratase, partial [Acidobacteriales bacterium]